MRNNQPVTQREHDFDADATLLSTTDVHSRIRYANPAFVNICGFAREELIDQPHNLVRHPDMPPEAFADMWQTLRQGKSWTGLVKNRCKNGDHYWVRANATPMHRNGQLVGYMSVRTRPDPAEVTQVEALYRAFREGKARGLAFCQGLVVRTDPIGRVLARLKLMPVRWRLRCALALIPLSLLVLLPVLVPSSSLWWAVSIGALASLGAGLWLERQIAAPLALILKQAQTVAAGSPGKAIHLDRVDEIGLIARSVNQAGLNLRALVDDVGAQVAGITAAVQDIARGNEDLAVRTEESAASVVETAASMEELSATVARNAEGSEQAAGLARQASEQAGTGGMAVERLVSTMSEISSSSDEISRIIAVIDGIAFQTNILALNASVEAARAGEHGRGFSVVASEVRTLAERSAQAARDIKTLINECVQRIETGVGLAGRAGDDMCAIVDRIQQVSDLMEEIHAASREQAQGVAQASEAVEQLDQMTQQNAGLVERSAGATGSLRDQVMRLDEALAVYRQ